MEQEAPLLELPGVKITQARAVLGSATFAVKQMTSVRVASDSGFGKRLIGALLVVLGLFFLAGSTALGVGILVVGAVLLVTAGKHVVMITTAGGEVEGMSARKKVEADQVAAVLTEAMIANRD